MDPKVRATLERAGAPADLIEKADPDTILIHLADEVTRLRPLADQANEFRNALVAEALAEGVRAHGNDFAKETYEGLLNAAPIATIRTMKADWEKAAKAVLSGGRVTLQEPQPPGEAKAAPDGPPADAYRV